MSKDQAKQEAERIVEKWYKVYPIKKFSTEERVDEYAIKSALLEVQSNIDLLKEVSDKDFLSERLLNRINKLKQVKAQIELLNYLKSKV